MMVNPDVDSYDKTLNHREINRKAHKNNNLLKAKRILKPKYHLRWRSGFHIQIGRGGGIRSSAPVSYVTGCDKLI